MKNRINYFNTCIITVIFLICFTGCQDFLIQGNPGNTTININLDLSKLIKSARNEISPQTNAYVLKLLVYDAQNYDENDKKIENLPLITQTSKKVDMNGTAKASIEVQIGRTVIFVGKLFTVNKDNNEAEKPIYAGKSEAFKVQPKDNKLHLVLSSEKAEIGFEIELAETHKHIFADNWTTSLTHHWKATTCGHTENVTGFGEHSFGEYVSNNDGTQTSFGTKTGECSVCGYKDTVTDKKVPEMIEVKGTQIVGATYTNNYEGVFIEGRTVILSDFYMGKYEVTQEEYENVMAGQTVTVNGTEYALESNPNFCTKESEEYTLFPGDVQEKRPVEGVTWFDAVWYCNALSAKEGLTPAYNIEVITVNEVSGKTGYYIYRATVTLNKEANGYRLPTEAEWEYAARGGDPTKPDWNYTFSGADKAEETNYTDDKNSGLDNVGWYCYNNITGETGDSSVTSEVSGKGTHQVGKKSANRLGIYDMSGNVFEWCYDYYDGGDVNTGLESDPTGSASTSALNNITRGGSWYNGVASNASVSKRWPCSLGGRFHDLGFRVVRSCYKD